MGKTADAIKAIAADCDAQVAVASKAIGGKDECTEQQIAAIVELACTNADHLTDAAVREDVRAAMKSTAYVYVAEKAKK